MYRRYYKSHATRSSERQFLQIKNNIRTLNFLLLQHKIQKAPGKTQHPPETVDTLQEQDEKELGLRSPILRKIPQLLRDQPEPGHPGHLRKAVQPDQ